ncbi:DUF3131 domain-containing protein [Xinfangfangia pollutisoli]|uniref:DUF3131 domain-containing protein n=1 Tax=Xinfangfangia pollutisoli TaxID=2865960 RepID=UPI001CD5A64B|nr:DUF3131 domain-containing protein [Xinfangfangia pollutisoli]
MTALFHTARSAPARASSPASSPSPLLLARSHIAMVLGLLGGLALVFWLEGIDLSPRPAADAMAPFQAEAPLPLARPRALTASEQAAAAIAWRYFQNNISPQTGLVASVDGYPSTTMWETGGLLDAILSAERLGLIGPDEAEARLTLALDSLLHLPLTEAGLPNKAYDIRDLAMVTYKNEPSKAGIGWSALDLGRLMAALTAVRAAHPDLAGPVQALIGRWDLAQLLVAGELTGGTISQTGTIAYQEGRIGYEQYAAKAMLGFALDATAALDVTGQLVPRQAQGIAVPGDSRLNKNQVPALVTSEPYLLDGLEFGFDARSHLLASQLYRAQERRFAETGIPTAVSEGHITEAPYFAYATVWGGGQDWAVLTLDGTRMDSRRTLSTKAAFGWDALFDTAYTARLVDEVAALNDPARGWMEGRYEADGTPNSAITANTNAMVLTALAYRVAGPLTRMEK